MPVDLTTPRTGVVLEYYFVVQSSAGVLLCSAE